MVFMLAFTASPWCCQWTASTTAVRSADCCCCSMLFLPRCKTPVTERWTTNPSSSVNWDQCPYWNRRNGRDQQLKCAILKKKKMHLYNHLIYLKKKSQIRFSENKQENKFLIDFFFRYICRHLTCCSHKPTNLEMIQVLQKMFLGSEKKSSLRYRIFQKCSNS